MSVYAECAALEAVMEDDLGEAVRIVRDFLPDERHTFKVQLETLLTLLDAERSP